VDRAGRQLYPAFPYTSYVGMTDADALALRAYLFSLQPVHAPARANSLSFPFNQRPLMRFWNLLFLPRTVFRPNPNQAQQWNRGGYLVNVLAHCGECHTPRNFLFGFERGKALSGETVQGWTAWNITSDADHGIGGWAPDDITNYLRWGYSPARGAAGGPMKEAVDNSLSKLTPQDLQAIAVYLKETKPIARGPLIDQNPPSLAASSLSAPGTSEPDSAGRRLFAGACEGCHAWNGEGRQTPIAALRGLSSVNDPQGLNVVQTILHGNSVAAPQGQADMPSYSAAYSDAEIAAMSGYVVQHFGGKSSRVTAGTVAQARRD
jgi:mono/diheme cytochrome c family protein